ncbi:MAG: SUMF1/EgtB/PvdO family nonheme iron enzyme [Nitrospinota bacterium]|nr:SUMF1/EgtB/PvdO family nonheme iron enzyme [Nitrospinota bacterium]
MKFSKPPALKPRVALLCCLVAGIGCQPGIEGMVKIPAGYFLMGTDAADREGNALSMGLEKPWYSDESPQREIYQNAFYIDKYEVTNRQYYIFCQATDCKPPPGWPGQKYPEGQDSLPVTGVSFFDATAYAQWIGKRLPTEQEWEKSARGPEGLLYPWGDKMRFSAANISSSSKKKKGQGLKPVGSHPSGASYYEAHDMVGNVWEWVWDYYQPYPDNQFRSNDYGKKFIVVRGLSHVGVGHFPAGQYKKIVALKARASYREKLHPQTRRSDVGFRCAKDPDLFSKRLYEFFFGKIKP